MKLRPFLDKYGIVLLDMDGVITSEYNYWKTSACTVWEVFCGVRVSYIQDNIDEIFNKVFLDTGTIREMKRAGVNTNWDVTYLMICVLTALDADGDIFKAAYDFFRDNKLSAPEIYVYAESLISSRRKERTGYYKREGEFWRYLYDIFQQWYMGDELYTDVFGRKPSNPGKAGLINDERPVIALDKIETALKLLTESGKRVGIGTGRTWYEVEKPLTNWDILKYFDRNSIVTYDDVKNAEEKFVELSLSKPHPYTFLKAMLGRDADDYKITEGDYSKELLKKTLVIGDAASDLIASRASGMDFAAVLTGVNGEAAREYFVQSGADYVLDDLFCITE